LLAQRKNILATKPIPEVKVVAIEPELVTDIAATLTTPGATPKGEPPPTIPTTLLSELSSAIPLPIPVTAPEPLQVEVVGGIPDPKTSVMTPEPTPAITPLQTVTTSTTAPTPALVTKGQGTTLQPTTTEQQDVIVTRQSHVALIWESVQGLIAIAITGAVIYCSVNRIISQDLSNAFFLIIGFYYSRTNHEKGGAASAKSGTSPQYLGRIL